MCLITIGIREWCEHANGDIMASATEEVSACQKRGWPSEKCEYFGNGKLCVKTAQFTLARNR